METVSGAFSAVPTAPPLPASTSSTANPAAFMPPRPCDSYNCTGIFLPFLLATLASSLLIGCVLMGATYAYQSAKRRPYGAIGTRIALVAVASLQVAVEVVNGGKVFKVFAANFADLTSFSRPRLGDTLAPFLGVVIQFSTLLLLIIRSYQTMRLRRWAEWKQRAVLTVLATGWLTSAVGGCGFALLVKALNGTTILAPGQPGGNLFDAFALLNLASSTFTAISTSALLVLERSTRRSRTARYVYMPPPALNKMFDLGSAALATGAAVAFFQAVALLAWILYLQQNEGPKTTWLHGLLLLLPAIYSCTAISALANPLPRPRPVRRLSKDPLSYYSTPRAYYDRPFLLCTTTSYPSASTSDPVSFGSSFPSIPPYSARIRLPLKREGGYSHSFLLVTHDGSGVGSGGSGARPSGLRSFDPTTSVSSLSHHPYRQSANAAVESTASQEQVLLPTIVIDVGADEEEDTLVQSSSQPGEEDGEDEEEETRSPADRADAVSLVFREVSRMGTGQKEVGGSARRKERRMGRVLPKREDVEQAGQELEGLRKDEVQLYPSPSAAFPAFSSDRRPSLASSTSADSLAPYLPSQRCSTPSVRQYDPAAEPNLPAPPALRVPSLEQEEEEGKGRESPAGLRFGPLALPPLSLPSSGRPVRLEGVQGGSRTAEDARGPSGLNEAMSA